MKDLAAGFFGAALIYGVIAALFGLLVLPLGAHTQVPTHAHLAELGWISFAIFGLFYHLFPERAAMPLARLHFWVAQVSLVALAVGFYLLYAGYIPVGEPIMIVAAIAYLLSTVLFGLVALPVVRSRL